MVKFLNIIDSKIKDSHLLEILEALEKEKQTYADNGVEIEHVVDYSDLSQVPWLTDIVSYSWIRQDTAELESDAYTVVYIFHTDNWKAQAEWIGGWHMGKYNGYQVQLIKAYAGNMNYVYLTMMMESMHTWDTPIWDKLNINLSKWLGVNNYDIDILHGMYGQGVTLSDEDSIRLFGEIYKKWDYSLIIKKIAPLLTKIFNPMTKLRLVKLDKDVWAIGEDNKRHLILNYETFDRGISIGLWDGLSDNVDSLDEWEEGNVFILVESD